MPNYYDVYVNGEVAMTVEAFDTDDAVQMYKDHCIADYRDNWGEDLDEEQLEDLDRADITATAVRG